MFAIFFHESMNQFHQIVTSFPTVIFTLLLAISALYWMIAVLGLVDLDILDVDADGDIDTGDSMEAQNAVAGLLHKFGLNGVPLTVIITLVSMVGWLLCYYTSFFVINLIPTAPLRFVAGLGLFLVATIISMLITAQLIRPIRKLCHNVAQGRQYAMALRLARQNNHV